MTFQGWFGGVPVVLQQKEARRQKSEELYPPPSQTLILTKRAVQFEIVRYPGEIRFGPQIALLFPNAPGEKPHGIISIPKSMPSNGC